MAAPKTLQKFSEDSGITVPTLSRWIGEGLPSHRKGRQVILLEHEVEAWIIANAEKEEEGKGGQRDGDLRNPPEWLDSDGQEAWRQTPTRASQANKGARKKRVGKKASRAPEEVDAESGVVVFLPLERSGRAS